MSTPEQTAPQPLPTTVEELQALLAAERAAAAKRIAELEKERDHLRAAYARLRQELELLKRRIFIAKAERVDTKQLELEFAHKLRELETLAGTLGIAQEHTESDAEPASDGKPRGKRKNNRGTGRRDLRELPLEEKRIELTDPALEALVAEGKVKRHGFDETCKLGHQRATKVRIVIARARYKAVDAEGNADVIPTPMPEQMLPTSIAAPSLTSHIVMENVGKGLPLYRIEDGFARDGIPIDRGTMSRWKKIIGETCLQTVVRAMHEHARATAFCISTDATGVCVQPLPSPDKLRQPCKKGHFLVMIADRDHILFEYLEKETSATIYARFRGFSGYVQADAKAVFNMLFAAPDQIPKRSGIEHDGCERSEVGCWYQCARRSLGEGEVDVLAETSHRSPSWWATVHRPAKAGPQPEASLARSSATADVKRRQRARRLRVGSPEMQLFGEADAFGTAEGNIESLEGLRYPRARRLDSPGVVERSMLARASQEPGRPHRLSQSSRSVQLVGARSEGRWGVGVPQ